MFRFKRSIPVDYSDQVYIYAVSRRYQKLPAKKRKLVRDISREAGKEYSEAVLEYVTTDLEAVQVCEKHHISLSTLERAVRRYYTAFAHRLKKDSDI